MTTGINNPGATAILLTIFLVGLIIASWLVRRIERVKDGMKIREETSIAETNAERQQIIDAESDEIIFRTVQEL